MGLWNGGLGPHQPFQSGSSCQPGGPNLFAPMISAPKPWLCRCANASSTPAEPSGDQNRVPNIHPCSRSPACPKGASSDCGSPLAKPSREMARLWTRTSDIWTPWSWTAPGRAAAVLTRSCADSHRAAPPRAACGARARVGRYHDHDAGPAGPRAPPSGHQTPARHLPAAADRECGRRGGLRRGVRRAGAVASQPPAAPPGHDVCRPRHRAGRRGTPACRALDEAASHEATLRVSRSAGLPGWLPDVYGMALRLGRDTATPVDLLFSTAWRSTVGRFLLAPRFTLSGAALDDAVAGAQPGGTAPAPPRRRRVHDPPRQGRSRARSGCRGPSAGVRGTRRQRCPSALRCRPRSTRSGMTRSCTSCRGRSSTTLVRRFREPSYRAARAAHPRPPSKPLP